MGDSPDDFGGDELEPEEPEEDGRSKEAESPQRGWIDPADRVWRHPSELEPGDATPILLNAPPRRRYRSALMVGVGAAAVGAAAAFIIFLLSPASEGPNSNGSSTSDTLANAPITTMAGATNRVPPAAYAAGRSMVELHATGSHGSMTLIGVAVAEGGFVVTTADALAGVQHVALVKPGGKLERASVVAIDHESDVALVSVPENVPVAPFADDGQVTPGTPDFALSLVPTGTSALALHSMPGSVTGVGGAIGAGPAEGMPSITSAPGPNQPAAPPPATTAGEPLLNREGSVLGILYGPASSTGATFFLPTQLVVGVADDLHSTSKVDHGWLGVEGDDVTGGAGAVIKTVDAKGPAAGHLISGDVVLTINSVPVRTMAELRARLYVLAPGTTVGMSVQDGSTTKVVDVTLGGSS